MPASPTEPLVQDRMDQQFTKLSKTDRVQEALAHLEPGIWGVVTVIPEGDKVFAVVTTDDLAQEEADKRLMDLIPLPFPTASGTQATASLREMVKTHLTALQQGCRALVVVNASKEIVGVVSRESAAAYVAESAAHGQAWAEAIGDRTLGIDMFPPGDDLGPPPYFCSQCNYKHRFDISTKKVCKNCGSTTFNLTPKEG